FTTGLFVLICSLFVPAVIAAGSIPQDARQGETILTFIVAGLAVYIAAVTVTWIVRHAVYSAILSIALLYAATFAVWLGVSAIDRLVAHQPIFEALKESPSPELMVTGLTSVAVAVALLGWLAVRYDWGRKS